MSTPLPKSIDIVVIGAGIIGASVSFHLAEAGAQVLVLEKEPLPGTGSTAAAAGGIRAQFSNELDIRYALETQEALPGFEERFGWNPEFHPHGYLYIARTEETLARISRNAEVGAGCGTGVKVMDAESISGIAPLLETSGLLGGVFGPGDGYCDPYGMMMGFLTAAKKRGAKVAYRAGLTGLKIAGGKVAGVSTDRGEVSCGAVVNCAGPFARSVAEMAGLDIPARPHKRYVFVTGLFPQVPKETPLVIDEDDCFYFRPESGAIIMSGMEEEPAPPDDTAVKWHLSENVAEKALRCSGVFAEAGFARAWAGLRTLTPDRRAILGPTPVGGFYLACGFSGHGVCHCVPAGRALAEYITTGCTTRLAIEPYFLNRFVDKMKMEES